MDKHPDPKSNPHPALEELKAATREVGKLTSLDPQIDLLVDARPERESSEASGDTNFARERVKEPPREKKPVPVGAAPDSLAEAFVQKIGIIEREKEKVTKELAKVDDLLSSLSLEKKQLENREVELNKIKDKIAALNQEIDNVMNQL